MEKLTIDEVIEHCKRHTEKYEQFVLKGGRNLGRTELTKQYLEHKQVAEWLEELKYYRELVEQGLLIRTRCAVGDKAYHIIKDNIAVPPIYISEHEITDVSEKAIHFADDWWTYEEMQENNVFLDSNEANQMLAIMRKYDEKIKGARAVGTAVFYGKWGE